MSFLLIDREQIREMNPTWTDEQVTAFYSAKVKWLYEFTERALLEEIQWQSKVWTRNRVA